MKFFKNFLTGLQVLFNPNFLKEKINDIQDLHENDAYIMILNKYYKKIEELISKYPNDPDLQQKLIEAKTHLENEKLKSIIEIKKEIEEREEKTCPDCQMKFLFSCNHQSLN